MEAETGRITPDPRTVQALAARLQERFDTLRERIRQRLIASDEQSYIELAGRVADPGDQSVAYLLRDLDYGLIDNELAELAAVERALWRVREGRYGVCIDCGGPVETERLLIEPEAERCSQCQAKYDHEHGKDRPPRL